MDSRNRQHKDTWKDWVSDTFHSIKEHEIYESIIVSTQYFLRL